tara:strand:- start:129 stop:335 length:207 start_codon:yes stop_codon:yes gene_type:complete
MSVVRCPVEGTFLVRDDSEPIPDGQTESSFSVAVFQYRFGWVCERCGFREGTTLQECRHVKAAKEEAR